jgi:hypothetical protein
MKRFFILASIVSLLASCDNGGGMETIENPVTVTFDTDGGADIAPMTVEAFSTIKLPAPKKDGYEFIGWYIIRNGNKELISGVSYQVDRDITIYARFVIWYPFEVSNISHTTTENDLGYRFVLITWDNPTDANFSHVGISSGELYEIHYKLQPGVNTFYKPLINDETSTHIKCADKNGNESKGIRYVYR